MNSRTIRSFRLHAVLACALLISLTSVSDVRAAIIVVQNGDLIGGKSIFGLRQDVIDLNNRVGVAYHAFFDGGISSGIVVQNVLTNDVSIIGRNDVVDGKTLFGASAPSLNDLGNLAFRSSFKDGGASSPTIDAIFTESALVARRDNVLADLRSPRLESPRINNSGDVVFSGSGFDSSFKTQSRIFSGNAPLVQSGDTVGGITLKSVGKPSQNNFGDTAFEGTFDIFSQGVFTANGPVAVPGDVVDGKTLARAVSPQINDNQDVSFLGTFSGGQGLFLNDQVLVETGATIDGNQISSIGGHALNNNGDVVFRASFIDQQGNFKNGVFTPDKLLITQGAIVQGKELTNIDGDPVINDGGDVAFRGRVAPIGTNQVIVLIQDAVPSSTTTEIQVRVIYTDGSVLSGPLSGGLLALPGEVMASFVLGGPTGATSFGLGDVLSASLAFGDAQWDDSLLNNFLLQLDPITNSVVDLTYGFDPLSTATMSDVTASNSTFMVRGIDRATGRPFEYEFATTSATLGESNNPVPEPTSFAVFSIGILIVVGHRWRRQRRSKHKR